MSVYRRQTRTDTCLRYGTQVFTGDRQEQPRTLGMEGECLQETRTRALGMRGECLQEKQVQPHAFGMEGVCLHKNSHKVSWLSSNSRSYTTITQNKELTVNML